MFEIIEKRKTGTIIKVFGVGGAGRQCHRAHDQGRATGRVHRRQHRCPGAGPQHRPRQGSLAKPASVPAPSRKRAGRRRCPPRGDSCLAARRHMVFITAGMGGGTGTGAAPVVAEVAREMGILTVGVVTKPFSFEGGKRMKVGRSRHRRVLQKHVDSLIVIPQRQADGCHGDDAGVDECFRAADDVLKNAVGGIAEIITYPGLVNVDFEDVPHRDGRNGPP